MYMVEAGGNVNEFELITPWDIYSLVLLRSILDPLFDVPRSIFVKPDITKAYVLGLTNESVYEFNLGIGTDGTVISRGVAYGLVTDAGIDLTTSGQTITKVVTNGITVTLSSADIRVVGKPMIIKTDGVGSGGGNAITITTESGELIDGSASDLTITTNFGSHTLFSDGTNLFITSSTT